MKTVMVNVTGISWDTEDYLEQDDIELEDLGLPTMLSEQEICLPDYDQDTPLEDIVRFEVEDVLMDGLTEEYGFCVNYIEWEYVKHQILKDKDSGKYIINDSEVDKLLVDENDKPLTFNTWDEAHQFADTLEGLMTNN